MALFGSKSSSSTTAQDNSNNVGEGSVGVVVPGSGNTVNMLAPGVLELAEKAIESVRTVANSVTAQASGDVGKAVEALASSRQATIPTPMIVGGVVIALAFVWGRGR